LKTNNPYAFFDTYCVRTPIFPLIKFLDLISDPGSIDAKIEKIWKEPVVQESIFLASPELHEEINKWRIQNLTDTNEIKRITSSLLKYISRMSSRCTPFGLFAGCSVGSFGQQTSMTLEVMDEYHRQTRFDMNFLVAFSQYLSKEEQFAAQLRWFTNNSLYKIGDQYRYVEYKYNQRNRREHALEAVRYTDYLSEIIKKANSGATVKDLVMVLIDDEISEEDALGFIKLLIENQILVSDLEPSLTGVDFLKQIKAVTTGLKDTEQMLQQIYAFEQHLDQIDQQIGNSVQYYQNIIKDIQNMDLPYEAKYLFQTDLYPKLKSNVLDIRWGYKIKRLMPVLNRLTGSVKNYNLQQFQNAFTKRYETREIPLTTALDTEIGIGYLQNMKATDSTPFLEGLHIPHKISGEQELKWDRIQEILSDKLTSLDRSKTHEIILKDSDFDTIEENWSDLPDTMIAMGEIVKIEGEEKMILSSVGGVSATTLLGRFTTGDSDIENHVKQITDIEKQMNPNHILAEIIHLPESRTGNILRRAAIRDYEIPYLGRSSVSEKNQIPIDDIMISVRRGVIRLRSMRLNKYILPKLGNAHNYSANALPIYHFLCDMQKQNIRSSIGFYWGNVLSLRSFLPRVVYKDFILSKARWKIKKKEIEELYSDAEEDILEKVAQWCIKYKIPRYVQIVEGDNTLLIDMQNEIMIGIWLDTVRKKPEFTLEEFLFTQDEGIVSRQGKVFTNQFVISFYNEEKLRKSEG